MSQSTDPIAARTVRDIYVSTLQRNPAISAAQLRELLLGAGLKLAKNEPHCTLNQLARQGRVIATLGTNSRLYSAADPQPDIARRVKREAPTAEDALQSSAQLATVTPVTEDPAQLLRRVLRDHLAEHREAWSTAGALAQLIDEPTRDVALALRDLVQAGDAQVRTEPGPPRLNYYAHPSAQRPAEAAAPAPATPPTEPPAAEVTPSMRATADAELATPTSSEATPAEGGRWHATNLTGVVTEDVANAIKKRVFDRYAHASLSAAASAYEAAADRSALATMADALPAVQAMARQATESMPLPAAIEWLLRDAEDLAGRAVDAGAPAGVIKALITASGAAARAAIAMAHTTPAAAGNNPEHAS